MRDFAPRFAFFVVVLFIAQFLSCSSDVDPSPSPDNYSSSNVVPSSNSTVVSSSSVAVVPSSSAAQPSSSSLMPSSSSSLIVVPSSSSVAPSSSSAALSSSYITVISSSSSFGVSGDDISNYRTVRIGTQTWMAENLNYNVSGKCYENNESNCAIYGRLYDWSTAMNLPANCNSVSCASQINAKHQGICPIGWHIPSDDDWDALMTAVGDSSIAGTKLKSSSLWNSDSRVPDGTDEYGFSALPGGIGYPDGGFLTVGSNGHWWSASENGSDYAYSRVMVYYFENVYYYDYDKGYLFSVRCLQD